MGDGLKIGLLGCGGIGRVHADRLAALGNPVSAFLDSDPVRAGELGGLYGGRVLPGFDAMLNECGAVIIATPPYLHTSPVCAAAGAGRHIFAEKPLCLTLEDAGTIGRSLSASRGVFMAGYVLRFFPAFRALREAYAAGAIGRLVSVRDRRMSSWKYWESAWLGDPAKSGGMTVEFFTHDLDWLLWVGGMPRRVLGRTAKSYPGGESAIEDNVWAWLDFPQGTGTGEASWTTTPDSSLQEITGETGSVVSGNGRIRLVREGRDSELKTPGEEPYLAQMREFLSCIREGRPPMPGFTEASRVLAVALAVQESARTGFPVTLPPPA